MNAQGIRVLMALSLLLISGQASAIPELTTFSATFYQPRITQADLTAGLLVEARTSLAMLGIGGGFTITCSTASSLPHHASDRAQFYDFFGARGTLKVPLPNGEGNYRIPDWTSMPPATCERSCTMAYSAEIADSSVQVNFNVNGVGVNFTLLPTGQRAPANSRNIEICRGGTPTCCNCEIP